jgi:hypothetical protein
MSNQQISNAQKQFVAERAGHCCEYCFSQLRFSPDPFSIEHIIPAAKGGSHEEDNLALACQGCNNHKFISTSAVDTVTGNEVNLYHPRRDEWGQHFSWSNDYLYIVGLTSIGRATVDKLTLNRKGVVNLRQVLRVLNEHPPASAIKST